MESHVINRIRICCRWLYFPMESRVINRIRRHLLLLAIFSIGKLCNKWYLELAIFSKESHVINRIRRHLLSFAIFSHGNSCNKSY